MKNLIVILVLLTQLLISNAQKSIDVTYIADAGFLITDDTSKILIDGIFNEGYGFYYTPAVQTLIKERNATFPFNDINAVLITHAHDDHINPVYLTEHMINDSETILLAPSPAVTNLKSVTGYEAIKDRIREITQINQSKLDTTIDGIGIKSMAIRHVDSTFLPTLNLGYIIDIDGFKVFHPGDADSTNLDIYQNLNLADESIDIALLPYWLFQTNTGINIVNYLNPKAIVITHVMLPQQTYNYTYVRNRIKNITGLPPVYFMEGSMDKLNFIKDADSVFTFSESNSAYLGQTPPGNTQKLFSLSVTPGYSAIERTAFSADGKAIYYSELDVNYNYNFSNARIKYYKYYNDTWNGPFVLFENYFSPSLSVDGDTMFFQKRNPTEVWYSVKTDTIWGTPSIFMGNLTLVSANGFEGNLQQTYNGTYYYTTSRAVGGIGGVDAAKLTITLSDTIIESLGIPLNNAGNNSYLNMAKDESYAITYTLSGPIEGRALISYPTNNQSWTNPKPMGFGGWATTISPDNKYLFYSSIVGTNYATYWIRIDNIIDSLKYTNSIPYVKSGIADQVATVGQLFSFTIPSNTFTDDDGNNTLMYNIELANGNPLPSWLPYIPATRTLSGTPATAEILNIRVTVTDTAEAGVYDDFRLTINPLSDINTTAGTDEIRIYPNPTTGIFTISFGIIPVQEARVKMYNLQGNLLYSQIFCNTTTETIDITDITDGIYMINVLTDDDCYKEKIIKN